MVRTKAFDALLIMDAGVEWHGIKSVGKRIVEEIFRCLFRNRDKCKMYKRSWRVFGDVFIVDILLRQRIA